MNSNEIAEHRKLRLQQFCDLVFSGKKSSLGRALGYRDGAFIGQMLRGERPITEKTVNQIHELPGGYSWFTGEVSIAPQTKEGIHIPLLANTGSMGSGEDHQDEDVMTGSLTLSPFFIQERIRPSRTEALRFINSYGDSMSPTFESGDVLLVDTGIRDVKINGIYVLSAQSRIFIKRVSQRMDGHFTVSSDNPSEKTVEVLNGDHQVNVLGRVVWVWNGRKL